MVFKVQGNIIQHAFWILSGKAWPCGQVMCGEMGDRGEAGCIAEVPATVSHRYSRKEEILVSWRLLSATVHADSASSGNLLMLIVFSL